MDSLGLVSAPIPTDQALPPVVLVIPDDVFLVVAFGVESVPNGRVVVIQAKGVLVEVVGRGHTGNVNLAPVLGLRLSRSRRGADHRTADKYRDDYRTNDPPHSH